MDRVIVVGTTGAGKTTLAERLAERMSCPFIELDALFWNPGWVQTPRDEFRRRVADAIAPERWTAGGNYGVARDLIWRRADTLVWLDYPLPLVLWRLFKRTTRRFVRQEVLWNGNRERFREHFMSRQSIFLWAIRAHPRHRRTWPSEFSRPEYTHLTIHHFYMPREAEAWLRQVGA